MIQLYELILADGCPVSPFVWRAKYALAHKGLAYETVPVGFTQIPTLLEGRSKTVPVIADGERWVADSWAIADYLDEAYPELPALFSSPQEHALVRFFDAWFSSQVMAPMFGLYVCDIHDRARPEDQPYFRRSREQRLGGQTLEAFTAGREERLPALRAALQPMRLALRNAPFLGGDTANYADYIALGGFLWVAAVSSLPPLAADDPLNDWLARGRALYGGLGEDARMRPLAA